METLALLIALLTNLPPTWCERDLETKTERDARLELPARELLAYSRSERAAAIAIGHGETTFARYTLFDCGWMPPGASGDCDKGLARSYWQLHQGVCPELWTVPSGSDRAVRIALRCAVRQWRYSLRVCGGRPDLAFGHYGGSGCTRTVAAARKALTYARLLARM